MQFTGPFQDLVASETHRAALVYVSEAFAEAILDGIDSECFAYAALFTALQELVDSFGEETVARFAEELPRRIRHGEFSLANKQ